MKPYLKSLSLAVLFFFFSGIVSAQISNESAPLQDQSQLQKLVAPIALYPDPLLAQILPASTYPLEIVEAARIIHKKKDFSKIDAQDWDPSVKAVAHYPDVLKMMNEKLDWTQQLGQAVLAQQQDVLYAVQAMRQQAVAKGNLKTTKQQIVQQTENTIEIVPANPEVVYVPIYDPQIVYYVPAVQPVISFGIGFPLGAWLLTGCFWPSYSLVYGYGPYWGYGWYRSGYYNYYYHYYHNYYHNYPNTYINRTTNIYNNNTYNNTNQVTQNDVRPWTHNENHGNPYNGRRDFGHSFSGNDLSNSSRQSGHNRQNSTQVREVSKVDNHHQDHGMNHRNDQSHDWNKTAEVQQNNYQNFRHGMNQQNQHQAQVGTLQNNPVKTNDHSSDNRRFSSKHSDQPNNVVTYPRHERQNIEHGNQATQGAREVHSAPERSVQNNPVKIDNHPSAMPSRKFSMGRGGSAGSFVHPSFHKSSSSASRSHP